MNLHPPHQLASSSAIDGGSCWLLLCRASIQRQQVSDTEGIETFLLDGLVNQSHATSESVSNTSFCNIVKYSYDISERPRSMGSKIISSLPSAFLDRNLFSFRSINGLTGMIGTSDGNMLMASRTNFAVLNAHHGGQKEGSTVITINPLSPSINTKIQSDINATIRRCGEIVRFDRGMLHCMYVRAKLNLMTGYIDVHTLEIKDENPRTKWHHDGGDDWWDVILLLRSQTDKSPLYHTPSSLIGEPTMMSPYYYHQHHQHHVIPNLEPHATEQFAIRKNNNNLCSPPTVISSSPI
jgi:hypothetical protein